MRAESKERQTEGPPVWLHIISSPQHRCSAGKRRVPQYIPGGPARVHRMSGSARTPQSGPISQKLLVHMDFVEANLRRRNPLLIQQSGNGLSGTRGDVDSCIK
jgi:hypothetical protein